MAGYTKITLFSSLLFLSLSIVLDLALIPSFGLVGAAIANSTALVAVNILRLVQIKRRLRLVPYDRSFWRPLVACVPASLIGFFVPLPAMHTAPEVLARGAILGFVYFVILWLLGIEPVDREVIRSAFARLRGRRSSDTAPTAPGAERDRPQTLEATAALCASRRPRCHASCSARPSLSGVRGDHPSRDAAASMRPSVRSTSPG